MARYVVARSLEQKYEEYLAELLSVFMVNEETDIICLYYEDRGEAITLWYRILHDVPNDEFGCTLRRNEDGSYELTPNEDDETTPYPPNAASLPVALPEIKARHGITEEAEALFDEIFMYHEWPDRSGVRWEARSGDAWYGSTVVAMPPGTP
jgi:hypothetical protein